MSSRIPIRSVLTANRFFKLQSTRSLNNQRFITGSSTNRAASKDLISPTSDVSVPNERTAYEFKPMDEPDPQLDQLGYPRVESVSRQWRNPYAKWDDPQERINFNEPLHAEEDMMGIWAPDVHKISVSNALTNMAVAFGVLGLILGTAAALAPPSPVVPRTFPFDGLTKELGGPGQGVASSQSSEDSED